MINLVLTCVYGLYFWLPVSTVAQDHEALKATFNRQLQNTPTFRLMKLVKQHNNTERLYFNCKQSVCHCDAPTPIQLHLETELEYALMYLATQPKIKDYFSIQHSEFVIIANRKAEYAESTDLQHQTIKTYPSGNIAYIRSVINRTSFLYETQIDIEVNFDVHGFYLNHTTILSTVTKLFSFEISRDKFMIKGSRE